MKKLFTLLTLVLCVCTGAWAENETPTVDDLTAISSNYTFIADDITSNGTVKLTANTLYDDGRIFAPTANTVAYNKGSVTFAGGSHLNSLRLKNTQDQLCFKVSGACTVTFYTQSHSSRGIQVGSSAGGTQYGSQTASTTEWSCDITAAGVVYLSSYSGDFYFAGFEVTFPKPDITTQPVSTSYPKDATASALTVVATASKGNLSYQWYRCDDANKTNASAIGEATSASYIPSTTSKGTFYYFCRVTDSNGSIDSNVATITVDEASAPTISVEATATSVFPNTSVNLTATIGGIPAPTIQWYSCDDAIKTNPVPIDGATSTTYSPSTATPGTYYFYAVATNSQGNATSDVITLTVNPLYTITYSLGEVTGTEGIVPASVQVESSLTIPVNQTLYKDGCTLTAWNDGSADHKIGSTFDVSSDLTLTPVFTPNGENAHLGHNATTVTWDFQTKNGAPTWQLEGAGKTAVQIAQTTVGGRSIDAKLYIDATSGKFNNASNNDWAQTNQGTKLTVPVLDGAEVKIYVYGAGDSPVTFGGNAGTYDSNIYSYTATTDGDLEIVIGDQNYSRYVSVTYPSETAVLNVTSNNTEAVLTKANIESNDYLSATDYWNNGKTYAGHTGDFENMSKADRYITLKVTGASTFEVYVQNGSAGRTYSVKVGDADAEEVTHGGSGVESSGIFTIANPSAETTIKLAGGGTTAGSVYPVYVKFNPTVSANISAYGYATFSSTYALDLDNIENAEAYIVTSKSGNSIKLQKVTGKVAANTGLILKSNDGGAANVTIPVTDEGTVYNSQSPTLNYLFNIDHNYDLGTSGNGTNYVLTVQNEQVVFAPIVDKEHKASVKAGQAALWIPSAYAGAHALTLSFADDVTGISEVSNTEPQTGKIYYNLQGQRVSEPKEGIYVVEGKKVLVNKMSH